MNTHDDTITTYKKTPFNTFTTQFRIDDNDYKPNNYDEKVNTIPINPKSLTKQSHAMIPCDLFVIQLQ